MKALAVTCVVLLSGCATCTRYPIACAVGGAIIVGSVAATIALHDDHHDHRSIQPHYGYCTNPSNPLCH